MKRWSSISKINYFRGMLKGVWHEIFELRFCSWISVPQAHTYSIGAVLNFFENSRRYSRINVYCRCKPCKPAKSCSAVSTTPAKNLSPVSTTLGKIGQITGSISSYTVKYGQKCQCIDWDSLVHWNFRKSLTRQCRIRSILQTLNFFKTNFLCTSAATEN